MKPIRIALDANEANVSSRVGSNVYAYRLLLELERQSRGGGFAFVVYLSSPSQPDFPEERDGWRYVVLTPKKLWTQFRFPLELYLHPRSHDLVLSLGHYAPRRSPIPSIVCVMDLAYLHFPEFFRPKDLMQLKAWTEYSVRHAKHVITISENSKLDIIKEYKRGPEDISIVYPGVDTLGVLMKKNKQEEILLRYDLETNKYLVCVGTIQPRKNMVNLIRAFEKLQNPEIKLVFVGKRGWLTTEFDETLAMSAAKDRIVVTDFVVDEVKNVLLKHSKGSVLVGFYEGFGIPPIEGMSLGVFPVVANTASLPEVVGDLGILVDPYSVDDIARGLNEVIAMRVTEELKHKLAARAAKFSWSSSGAKMLSVLENLGHKL